MKSVVLFACLIVLIQGLTDEQNDKLKRHQRECLVESGVNAGSLAKLASGDYTNESDEMKKFSLCMFIKSELMNKEGDFKKDVALSKIQAIEDVAIVEQIIDACLTIGGEGPEERAWNFIRCYQQSNPEHPLL